MLGIMLRHQRRRREEDCLTAVLLIKRAEVSPLGRGPPLSSCLTTRNSGPTLAVFIFKWLSSWAGFSQQTQEEGKKTRRLAWIELFLVWEYPRRQGRGFKLARQNDQKQFSMIIEHRLPTLSTGVTLFSLNSNVTADRCWSTQRNGEATGAWALRLPAYVLSPESRYNKTLYNWQLSDWNGERQLCGNKT